MRLTISKSLILVAITMGLVTVANGSAEAYPPISEMSQDALASDGVIQYLAQFPGSRNRPDRGNVDFEDCLEDREDCLEDMEDRREDIEDRREDMEDFRDDMEDFRDDRGNGPRRRNFRVW